MLCLDEQSLDEGVPIDEALLRVNDWLLVIDLHPLLREVVVAAGAAVVLGYPSRLGVQPGFGEGVPKNIVPRGPASERCT